MTPPGRSVGEGADEVVELVATIKLVAEHPKRGAPRRQQDHTAGPGERCGRSHRLGHRGGDGGGYEPGERLGIRLGMRLSNIDAHVYVLMGDGEQDEGQVWEAAQFATHHGLSHLTAIIDLNGSQALGPTREVINLSPMAARWEAFGWEAVEVDGHDNAQLAQALAPRGIGKPRVVVARTLSKAYGLAGLRVGYGVASREIVETIERSRGPYKLNALAERAAVAAMTRDREWVVARAAEAVANLDRLAAALATRGLVALPSATNFLCVPTARAMDYAAAARTAFDTLLERGKAAVPHAAIAGVLDRGTHFGLSHDLIPKLAAKVIELVPSAEFVRFANSGTEAISHSLRIARARRCS